MKTTNMNTKNDKIKILPGLALLLLITVLFGFPLVEQNLETVFSSWASTPGSLHDEFIPSCREIVLEVLEGDTLDSISLNYAIPKKNIMNYNCMSTDEVYPGMVLLIQLCRDMPTPTVTPVK
jgi:hypothetical protein